MLVFLFEDFSRIYNSKIVLLSIFSFHFPRRTKLCVKQSGNYSNLKLKCMKYFHLWYIQDQSCAVVALNIKSINLFCTKVSCFHVSWKDLIKASTKNPCKRIKYYIFPNIIWKIKMDWSCFVPFPIKYLM